MSDGDNNNNYDEYPSGTLPPPPSYPPPPPPPPPPSSNNNKGSKGSSGSATTTTTSTTTTNYNATATNNNESHRIYWQQWIQRPIIQVGSGGTAAATSTSAYDANKTTQQQQQVQNPNQQGRYKQELITGSAAIRLSKSAKAVDVTSLLRRTLDLGELPTSSSNNTTSTTTTTNEWNNKNNDQSMLSTTSSDQYDCLVLVGTLFSLPRDYVKFDEQTEQQQRIAQKLHEQRESATPTNSPPTSSHGLNSTGGNSNSNNNNGLTTNHASYLSDTPFHIIKTLKPNDKPLLVRDKMNQYLQKLLQQSIEQQKHYNQQTVSYFNYQQHNHSTNSNYHHRTIISPKLQWYFVPSPSQPLQLTPTPAVVATPPIDEASLTTNATVSTTDTATSNNLKAVSSSGGGTSTYPMNRTLTKTPTGSVNMVGGSFIPNCIELDGYCSSMDNADYDTDTDTDSDSVTNRVDYYDDDDTFNNDDTNMNRIDNEEETSIANQLNGVPQLDMIQQNLFDKFDWLNVNGNKIDNPTINDKNNAQTEDLTRRDIGTKSFINIPPRIQRCLRRERKLLKRRRSILEQQSASSSRIISNQQQQQITCSSNAIISGYLLKRDKYDPHVWKRVHCIVTEDDLWYDSRIYTKSMPRQQQSTSTTSSKQQYHQVSYAKHGRIQLTNAIVLEPSVDYLPLYRTPYSFEIVSTNGISHVFRCSNAQEQKYWTTNLSERIVQSYENSLLETAEMFLIDETTARNSRITTIASQPLWNCILSNKIDTTNPELYKSLSCGGNILSSVSIYSSLTGAVLRWGIQVAEYREYCRYIRSILPAKNPIVAVSESSRHARQSVPETDTTASSNATTSVSRFSFFARSSTTSKQQESTAPSLTITSSTSDTASTTGQLNDVTRTMIRSAWDTAATLLARASHVANNLLLQQQNKAASMTSTNSSASSLSSLNVSTTIPRTSSGGSVGIGGSSTHHSHVETLCLHIDYVITGRFRPLGAADPATNSITNSSGASFGRNISSGNSVPSSISHQHHTEPPPTDLFDPLLIELQKLAATAHR